jgi:hypothetical protein
MINKGQNFLSGIICIAMYHRILCVVFKKLPAPDHKEPDADSGRPDYDSRIERRLR